MDHSDDNDRDTPSRRRPDRDRNAQDSDGRGKSNERASGVAEAFESRLGKTQGVNPIAPLSQQAGYFCSVCDCVVKDSANYLDHINWKEASNGACPCMSSGHLSNRFKRDLNFSRSEKRLAALLSKILKQQQELEELKRQRREKKKEKKKEKTAGMEEVDIDPDVEAMMGFGGFGSSKW